MLFSFGVATGPVGRSADPSAQPACKALFALMRLVGRGRCALTGWSLFFSPSNFSPFVLAFPRGASYIVVPEDLPLSVLSAYKPWYRHHRVYPGNLWLYARMAIMLILSSRGVDLCQLCPKEDRHSLEAEFYRNYGLKLGPRKRAWQRRGTIKEWSRRVHTTRCHLQSPTQPGPPVARLNKLYAPLRMPSSALLDSASCVKHCRRSGFGIADRSPRDDSVRARRRGLRPCGEEVRANERDSAVDEHGEEAENPNPAARL